MKVQEAIKTIETHRGFKFIGRHRAFNLDTNRTETAYVFTSTNGDTWGQETWFDCLRQLRFYANYYLPLCP